MIAINEREIEKQSVMEIQRIMRELSRINTALPDIYVDGIYGEETTDAVIAFQRQYGLPVNGIVDYTTWKKLHSIYDQQKYILNRPNALTSFFTPLESGKISRGDKSDLVTIIQHILHTMAVQFDEYSGVVITGVFDEPTEKSIRTFQKSNNLDVTGNVDLKTWNRLSDIYNEYAPYGG